LLGFSSIGTPRIALEFNVKRATADKENSVAENVLKFTYLHDNLILNRMFSVANEFPSLV
jgi:hypothetical protein